MAKDKQAEEIYIVEPEVHNDTIYLEDYNPDWPIWFEEEAQQLREILGERALQIEHVGSTSVPRLKAKSKIDMILVVEDSSNEPSYVPDLTEKGYSLIVREREWFEHRMLRGPKHKINLHVFSKDCSEVEKMLAFRDWLRENKADRKRYAEIKGQLSQKKWKYVQDYANAKGDVVQEIMKRALRNNRGVEQYD